MSARLQARMIRISAQAQQLQQPLSRSEPKLIFITAAGSGVALSYAGTSVTGGEFGAWTPIAATQTASGYDVAWQNTGTGQYTVWTTDSNGNYTGNLIGAVSGNSYALESLESTFKQDLNGDGVIGLNPLVIQTDTSSFGSTSLPKLPTFISSLRPAARPGPSCSTMARPSPAESLAVGIRSEPCRPRVAMRLLGSGRTAICLQCGPPTATATTREI